jgi:competence protein ComEA
MDESGQKEFSFSNKNVLPLLLGVGGLIFFGYGLMSLSAPKKDKPDILFEAASDKRDVADGRPSTGSGSKEIAVDVEGAVMKPGVYKIKADSRVQDALIAAGGMSEDADREKAAKGLNLASKVTDGAKIYIPANGEEVAALGGSSGGTVMGASSDTVNINSASSEELEALPGIGKVTAGKIIDNRPYNSVQELVDKKVVGKSVFEKIKEKIGV